ncbi:hypothetical protein AGMMS49959_01490 [Planctomycetales bacterium]|nr:hypothetical protein AGMMS49959_01490 [Planctomycetales bacterium]
MSNTLTADFCVEALAEALQTYGTPAIFNSAQGSQSAGKIFARSRSLLYRQIRAAAEKMSVPVIRRDVAEIVFDEMWHSPKCCRRSGIK